MDRDELLADWKRMRAALAAQLVFIESRKGENPFRAPDTIEWLKNCIADLDQLIEGAES